MEGLLTPFGKYFLLERINVGGMAEVFKAKTVGVEGFEKIVAIKRILPSVAEDAEFIRMFVDEAKIASQLSHANLAQTFDLGRIGDTYYIAMEYVPGKDLRAVFERLQRRGERMPLPLAAHVVARLCEGLDYAHRKRDPRGRDLHIVHRDVSPQNVIVGFEGEVKLIDFGIAKAANKMTRTQAGILKGKFGYMSPEQVRGLALDGRSDVFAAGIVLYELCTGERLFTGANDHGVLEKVQQAQVPKPGAVDPRIPPGLERVMLKALARERDERYQQAADFAEDLQRFLRESGERAVTRDDVAAFMRGLFPGDGEREAPTARGTPPVESTVPDAVAPRAPASKALAVQETQVLPRPERSPDGATLPFAPPDSARAAPPAARRATLRVAARAVAIAALAAAAAGVSLQIFRASPLPAKRAKANVASLEVTTDPPDALLFLDGAQVKGPGEARWSAARVAAGAEHVLTARRQGFGDQELSLTLEAGEDRSVALQLVPAENELHPRPPPAARKRGRR